MFTCSEAQAPGWWVCWALSPRAQCAACLAAWCWWQSRWWAPRCPPTQSWSGHCPWPQESRLTLAAVSLPDNSWHWPWLRTEELGGGSNTLLCWLLVVWTWATQKTLDTCIDQLSAPCSHSSLEHVTRVMEAPGHDTSEWEHQKHILVLIFNEMHIHF